MTSIDIPNLVFSSLITTAKGAKQLPALYKMGTLSRGMLNTTWKSSLSRRLSGTLTLPV